MRAAPGTRSGSALMSLAANGRRRSCPRARGRPPRAPATGHCSAAQSRRDSNLLILSWHRRAGSPRDFVGWVERSDTHHLTARMQLMGIAALHPSYNLFLHTISFAAIKPPPAIRIAAMAIVAVGCAKPARIRNAVESKGVA